METDRNKMNYKDHLEKSGKELNNTTRGLCSRYNRPERCLFFNRNNNLT